MSQDIGKILIMPKSTWVNNTNYEILDAVTYQGKAYISKQSNNIGNTPSGQTDTYWFMFAKDGRSITGISKTGSATVDGRVVDTYTITYNEGNPDTFTVTNGKDGEGSGDMLKSAYDSDNSVANAGGIASYVSNRYSTGDTVETALADDDYVPFYDTSASAKRKTLWSNIKSVLKTYFDTLYSTVKTRGTPTSGGTALSLVNTGDMYAWNSKQNAPIVLTATLATPNTQVTFTNAAITANARIQVFTNVPGLNYESMDASTANTIVLTYEAQNTNVTVQLVIW